MRENLKHMTQQEASCFQVFQNLFHQATHGFKVVPTLETPCQLFQQSELEQVSDFVSSIGFLEDLLSSLCVQ